MTAKHKLTQWMRDQLESRARKLVAPKAETKAVEAAYLKAEPLVRAIVHAKFPPHDMAVCKKYGAALIDDCIKLSFPNGAVDVFHFKSGCGPLVTKKTYDGQIYLADAKAAAAVEKWSAAAKALKDEQKKRVTAYRALIDGARYVEDVAVIWPEALTVIPPALPIALSPIEVAVVKADIKERAA